VGNRGKPWSAASAWAASLQCCCACIDLASFSLSFSKRFRKKLAVKKKQTPKSPHNQKGIENGSWAASTFCLPSFSRWLMSVKPKEKEWNFSHRHAPFSSLVSLYLNIKFKLLRQIQCDTDYIFNGYRCLKSLLFACIVARFCIAAI